MIATTARTGGAMGIGGATARRLAEDGAQEGQGVAGGVEDGHRGRSGNRYAQPDQRRKPESRQSSNFQPHRVPRAEVPDHPKRQQENPCGNCGQRDQAYIDNAMKLLAAAAMLAVAGSSLALTIAALVVFAVAFPVFVLTTASVGGTNRR